MMACLHIDSLRLGVATPPLSLRSQYHKQSLHIDSLRLGVDTG